MVHIKVWHLSNCSTCQRIIEELGLNESNSELQNIKEKNISQKELELIVKTLEVSYEDVFSKRALKYKHIKDTLQSDEDFKKAILEEYTFLKRPVIQVGEEYFVGNSKKTVEAAKAAILR